MRKNLVIFGLFFMSMVSGIAQNNNDFAKLSYEELGFENIAICMQDNVLYSKIEDSAFRGNFRGPAEAIKKITKLYPQCERVEMVVEEYGNAKVCVHASRVEDRWVVDVDYDFEDVRARLSKEQVNHSSYGKVDVNLIPIVSLDNHLFDKLFEVGVFLAPSFETTLWKGNRLIVQPMIPLYTNFVKSDARRNVRLGVAALSQDVLECERWNAKVSAGAFYPDVVGVYGEVGYRVNNKLNIGLHAGYSYTSVFYNQKWYIGSPSMCNVMGVCDYYDPATSLQFQVQAGRFMYGDWGGRIDLTRHFGEYAIGVYGILTGGEHNGGFHFAIPFGGKKQVRKGFIRMRLPEYYDFQYSMVSYWRYTLENMGREFEEIPDKNRSAHYWQPEYIKKYMQKYLDDSIE